MPAHDPPQFGSPLLKRRAAAKSGKARRKPSDGGSKRDSETSETDSQMSKSEMGTRYNHQWHRNGNFVKFRYPQRFHDQFKEPEKQRQSMDHNYRLPLCLRRNLRYSLQPVRLMCQYTPTKSLTFVKSHNIKSNKLPHPLHRSFKKDRQEEESFGGSVSARSSNTITLHAREEEEEEGDRNGSFHMVYQGDRTEQSEASNHTSARSETRQDDDDNGGYSDDQFENENEDQASVYSGRDDEPEEGKQDDEEIRSVHSEQEDAGIKSDVESDTDLPIQEAHESDKANGNTTHSDSSSVHSDMETMNWNSESPRAQARPMTALGSRGNSGRARITTSVSLKQKRADD